VLVPDDSRPATPPSDLIEIQVVKVTDTTLVPEPPEPGSLHCALCPAVFRLVSELLFHEHGHLAGAEGGGQGGDPSRCHHRHGVEPGTSQRPPEAAVAQEQRPGVPQERSELASGAEGSGSGCGAGNTLEEGRGETTKVKVEIDQ
ncbi:hypothetical protein E2I00_017118, partial [Balaenoptera physalus]